MRFTLKTLAITATVFIVYAGSAGHASAAENITMSKIPQNLISRNLKKDDPSPVISVDTVFYKIRRNQQFSLVDVRSKQEFERLHIPGSINIPLHAVKVKTYLRSDPVVLVNQGLRYDELGYECRRLAERGFKVFILDGGLPTWHRKGGQLVGDLFGLDAMKTVSPQVFFQIKDCENTLAIDISAQPSNASSQLIPYAEHIPVLDDNEGSAAGFRKLISQNKNKALQSIIVFNETGQQYEMAEKILNRMGRETFYLQGGVAGYRKYLAGLLLSWTSRASRMKRVSDCRPCGEKIEEK